MSTANLNLPTLTASQAAKEITHNEALAILDAIVPGRVQAANVTDPETLTPSDSQVWIVASGAVNAWAGHDGDLAVYYAGEWFFVTPEQGWQVWNAWSTGMLLIHDGADWRPWSEYALLNGNNDFYFGGTASIGVGDKDWAVDGVRAGAKFELYRSTSSAFYLAHNDDGTSEAGYSIRCGTKDIDLYSEGNVFRIRVEGVDVLELDDDVVSFTPPGGMTLASLVSVPSTTTAPTSPAANEIRVADGVSWDPAARGSGPYPVFYDGAAWQPMT